MAQLIAAGAVGILVGLASGWKVCYISCYLPLWKTQQALVDKMLHMRKQGFVPQFDIEQAVKPDLAAGIVEF